MDYREGLVMRGINNIYTVLWEDDIFLCRIKGKQLQGLVNEYNQCGRRPRPVHAGFDDRQPGGSEKLVLPLECQGTMQPVRRCEHRSGRRGDQRGKSSVQASFSG